MRRKYGGKGFTLIELLVVIGMVMLLVGIMLPSLSRAREHSKQLACATNMRSIGQAMSMYADENSDSFPVTTHVAQEGGWIRTVAEYLQEQRVYRCPSDSSTDWFNTQDAPSQQLINDRVNSYATNVYISPRKDPPPGAIDSNSKYGFLIRRLIPFPGETVHFAELATTNGPAKAADHLHADQWVPSMLTGRPLSDPRDEIALNRHLKAENYAFTDGHVEGQPFIATFEWNEEESALRRDHWNPLGRRIVEPGR